MCFGGGSAPAPDTRAQQESLKLQREQLDMARKSQERQQKQYEEQMRISSAPPPPSPNPVAQMAAPALMESAATAPLEARKGMGRRKMRTDVTSLSIPGG
ncbi:hypothetical protein EBT31_12995 [bacterium]|nr:hypothetical protein [bacterium]